MFSKTIVRLINFETNMTDFLKITTWLELYEKYCIFIASKKTYYLKFSASGFQN